MAPEARDDSKNRIAVLSTDAILALPIVRRDTISVTMSLNAKLPEFVRPRGPVLISLFVIGVVDQTHPAPKSCTQNWNSA